MNNIPQILSGASSSKRMGWLRNISRDFMHRLLISVSVSWTFFPGLDPRTGVQQKHQHVVHKEGTDLPAGGR